VGGVILHTDRGSEYTAARTAAACRALGVVQSMGRVGSALDNAAAEAFNSTLKVEFVHRHHFTTRAEARIKISTWIADFYNTSRRHSANDGLSPITFEQRMTEARKASTGRSGITPSPRFQGIDTLYPYPEHQLIDSLTAKLNAARPYWHIPEPMATRTVEEALGR
jgi:hypothetical protein